MGLGVWPLFYYALFSVFSSFAEDLDEEACFSLIVLMMSRTVSVRWLFLTVR